MIKNAQSLMEKAKSLAKKYKVTTNEILQNYMFERLLERLSVSKYKHNFILKGGLLLSSIMGISTRTTMDMDTVIKGIKLTDEELFAVLNEIVSIDVSDNVNFTIKNTKPIKEDDDYSGLKFNLLAQFDHLRVNLSIDIATGDLITPREIEYNYQMMFEERKLKIMAYNIETIIAEKFQTIITRGVLNSRMKDYYDIYYLISHKNYSTENLKLAIKNTFSKRETNINSINKVLSEIEKSNFIKDMWEAYRKKHSYANNIEFKSVVGKINQLNSQNINLS